MENLHTETKRSIWNTVTPFSKYLTMAIFIGLPFAGFYIGYSLHESKSLYEMFKPKQYMDEIYYERESSTIKQEQLITGDAEILVRPAGADPETYTILDRFFSKDTNSVYGPGKSCWYPKPTPIIEADVESFELMKEGFARDKNNIYFCDSGFDTDEFRVFKGNASSLVFVDDFVFVYDNSVYVDDNYTTKLVDADAKSFELMSPGIYRDHDSIFVADTRQRHGSYRVTKILNADPESFETLSSGWRVSTYKDKNLVYFNSEPVPKIDADSAQNFAGVSDLVIDKNYLWGYKEDSWEIVPYENIDVDSLKIINPEYKTAKYIGKDDYPTALLIEDKNGQYVLNITDNEYRASTITPYVE